MAGMTRRLSRPRDSSDTFHKFHATSSSIALKVLFAKARCKPSGPLSQKDSQLVNETPRHTSHEFFTSILRFSHFTNLIFVKMVGGGLMVNTLDSQSRSPGSRVGLAGTICCSLVRNNLLSQSLSPPRSIKGCQGSLMKFWWGGGGGG